VPGLRSRPSTPRAARAVRDPKGGGDRTTGGVEALARWADIAPRAFPSLSCDPRRAAPVHGEKSGLALKRLEKERAGK